MVLTQYNRQKLIEKLELDIKFILDQTTVTGFTTVQHRKWIELELKEKSFNQTIKMMARQVQNDSDKMITISNKGQASNSSNNSNKENKDSNSFKLFNYATPNKCRLVIQKYFTY